jgi:tRNA dimethylallyltransferase
MKERSIAATRQFAKRQLTWLRAEPETVWFDSLALGFLDRVLEYLYATGMLRK